MDEWNHCLPAGAFRMGFRFELSDQITCVAAPTILRLGADDRTVIAVANQKLLRMDLQDRTQVTLCSLPHPASDFSINVDHSIVAVAAGAADVAIYDLKSGDHLQSMSREGAPGSLSQVPAKQIAVGSDGKMLVATTSGSRIFVSNMETGQWEHIMFVKYDGCGVAVSPNGKYVALFGAPKESEISGHVTMFLVRRGLQPLWTRWHDSAKAVTSCRFSPDSKSLITCGAGDGVRVWESAGGELQWHFAPQGKVPLRSAWSFGVKDSFALLGDDLMIVEKNKGVVAFQVSMESPDSKFAISESGKVMARIDNKRNLSVWKLNEFE